MLKVYGSRRHLLDIFADILTVALNEYTLISHIVGQSNLSFQKVSKYLDILFELEFLEKRDIIEMERFYYITTKKGMKFLEYYTTLSTFLVDRMNKLHA